jgi:hypothetical protein
MKLKHLFFLLFMLISLVSFVGAADVFECKIPPGWHFHDAAISESGLKAVVTWEDVSEEVARNGNYASRLLIFDKDDRLVNELTFANPKFLRLTRDDKIILEELMEAPREEVEKITVFDSQGRELFETPTKGRWSWPALLGREIGLAREDGAEITGRISIIDGETGQERITFGPPSGSKRIKGFSGFLPIGEGGKYLVALGGTVFLKTYLHPGTSIWKIDSIGGNVRSIYPIDENLVGIKYEINDHKHKYLAGVAVVEWRSGNIVFKQDSNEQTELGHLILKNPDITIKEGDLFFTFSGFRSGIRVAKSPQSSKKWDKTKVRKYKIDNWPERDELTIDSKHIIKKLGKDTVRIEKIRYKEENWKENWKD